MDEELNKAEAEKTKKDHSLRALNDEINQQEDAIQKLNKEKKFYQETMSRADEELQSAEDKLNHLSMVKGKLEQTLDDLEDTLEREKRSDFLLIILVTILTVSVILGPKQTLKKP